MARLFINCLLRTAYRRPEMLDRHFRDRTAPELGLDALFMDEAPQAWHVALARRLDEANLPRSVHLPFFDLQPGSADCRIRSASIGRLREAFSIATIYRPHHLVGHASFDRFLYSHTFDAWAERAATAWAEALSVWPDHPPLYLENTHETDPGILAGFMATLRAMLPSEQADRIGVCFDIGHWFGLATGPGRRDLAAWIAILAPVLAHLHLHDNDGSSDSHLAPGEGRIPFDQLFALLSSHNLRPSATFEPHTDAAYANCLTYVANQPGMAF